jgi:sugar lactone lactonase YvrE
MYDPTSARIRSGHLHRADPSGDQLTLLDDVGVANGLAFSPDGTIMYFADTFDRTVWAFDYNVATGTPSNRRIFLAMGELPGKPDGACVDEEGGYWLACVRGGAVIRVLPSGEVERRIELPVSAPTMPAFGGPDLDVLYITSIGAEDEPLSGSLLAIHPGVRGLPEPWFGG